MMHFNEVYSRSGLAHIFKTKLASPLGFENVSNPGTIVRQAKLGGSDRVTQWKIAKSLSGKG
ncbi:MAG TPA: hypothetical protein DDW65_17565 [Firmicutes bacterium]|jgi:hypothetical protein|nr:hypothetical protein [Bacillota bacterium]